jgi:hypothetical protein
MESNQLNTPVLFLVFNRPEPTKEVFEAIRRAKPKYLFVAADGARAEIPGERERCEEVRRLATAVDWDCEVSTFFHDENAGCGEAVSSAITWFFDQVEEGIILEDDCLPSPDFFRFCATLLEHYRHDTRIMQIGGVNVLLGEPLSSGQSYFFSNHNNIWGWATWRRAWKHYDFDMRAYAQIAKDEFYNDQFPSVYERAYYNWSFEMIFHAKWKSSWSYQWEFARRLNSGLTITPLKNLIVNIGFGEDATHTTSSVGASSQLRFESMDNPIKHPPFILSDRRLDTLGFVRYHTTPKSRLKTEIRSMLPRFLDRRWVHWRLQSEMDKRPERYATARQPFPVSVSIRKGVLPVNENRV